MALTPKQQRFVDEYLVDLNATQAAIRAGYSPKVARQQGSENLSKPDIAAAVARAQEVQQQRTGITADSVLRRLDEVAGRCMQHVPVMVRRGRSMVQKMEENEEGDIVGVWEFDSGGACRALELLGKHLKLFTEKHEHTGKDGAPIQVITGVPASPEDPPAVTHG